MLFVYNIQGLPDLTARKRREGERKRDLSITYYGLLQCFAVFDSAHASVDDGGCRNCRYNSILARRGMPVDCIDCTVLYLCDHNHDYIQCSCVCDWPWRA